MICPRLPRVYRATARCIHSVSSVASYNLKYAEKLQQKAKEKGLDLEDLKLQAREEAYCRQTKEAPSFKKPDAELPRLHSRSKGAKALNVRKDSSPVKPLSSILNLPKLLATPHTSSQISALWTAYHASRTGGTGKGYICASFPVESYNAMMRAAKKYPVFVIPVPRDSTANQSASGSAGPAHEFYFLQWDFHPAPSAAEPTPFEPAASGGSCHIPGLSTVLFTPLQEYKLRTSFATPYLVLTFYTDVSQSHGIVLLRGQITPSSTPANVLPGKESPERFLLNQVDAQLLAMGLQKFYLWEKDGQDLTAEALLKQFHEEPEKFNWQDLLKFSNFVA